MKTYIIHVSDAYDREIHMQKQLEGKNLNVVYITKGDKKDLSNSILVNYFRDYMAQVSADSSCAYKHLLVYHEILQNEDDIALILEDDIRFYSNYNLFPDVLDEMKKKKLKNFILSLEDSTLTYIPKSKRIKNTLIYREKKGRTSGAYLIDKEGAKNLLDFLKNEKTNLGIDLFHNLCIDRGVINMYWCHPAIFVQGSLDGTIKSYISSKRNGTTFRYISFKAQKIYKKLLYRFR